MDHTLSDDTKDLPLSTRILADSIEDEEER